MRFLGDFVCVGFTFLGEGGECFCEVGFEWGTVEEGFVAGYVILITDV